MITLSSLPELTWPVVVLAAIQLGDGLICIKPVAFVGKCLDDIGWPRQYRWMMPVTKLVAVAALIAGIWVPYLGLLAVLGVVAYFVVAIGLHIRAQDFGRNLFLNATGMLALSIAALVLDFVRISSV